MQQDPSTINKSPITTGLSQPPSLASVLALVYGGGALAGLGLFTYLTPDQALIPFATGKPAVSIFMIVIGFAIDTWGLFLLLKRQRLLREAAQSGQNQ